jgi:hypothetical protein
MISCTNCIGSERIRSMVGPELPSPIFHRSRDLKLCNLFALIYKYICIERERERERERRREGGRERGGGVDRTNWRDLTGRSIHSFVCLRYHFPTDLRGVELEMFRCVSPVVFTRKIWLFNKALKKIYDVVFRDIRSQCFCCPWFNLQPWTDMAQNIK